MELGKVFREIFTNPAVIQEEVELMRNPAAGGASGPDAGCDDADVLERLPSSLPPAHDVVQLRPPRIRFRQSLRLRSRRI